MASIHLRGIMGYTEHFKQEANTFQAVHSHAPLRTHSSVPCECDYRVKKNFREKCLSSVPKPQMDNILLPCRKKDYQLFTA